MSNPGKGDIYQDMIEYQFYVRSDDYKRAKASSYYRGHGNYFGKLIHLVTDILGLIPSQLFHLQCITSHKVMVCNNIHL